MQIISLYEQEKSEEGLLISELEHLHRGNRHVGLGSAKLCCTGPTTPARFETDAPDVLTNVRFRMDSVAKVAKW
jgi:hypothetical protein